MPGNTRPTYFGHKGNHPLYGLIGYDMTSGSFWHVRTPPQITSLALTNRLRLLFFEPETSLSLFRPPWFIFPKQLYLLVTASNRRIFCVCFGC